MNHILSREVKESISFGGEEALRLGHSSIGPEHLLLGLLRQGNNAAFYVLKDMPVDIGELQGSLEKRAQRSKRHSLVSAGRVVPLTRQAEAVMRDSAYIAESFTSKEVEPEYLMLSLLQAKENKVSPILRQMGVNYASFLRELV
jgi:ATP-dependent Clp protease ATP-binding subunit ClpC